MQKIIIILKIVYNKTTEQKIYEISVIKKENNEHKKISKKFKGRILLLF